MQPALPSPKPVPPLPGPLIAPACMHPCPCHPCRAAPALPPPGSPGESETGCPASRAARPGGQAARARPPAAGLFVHPASEGRGGVWGCEGADGRRWAQGEGRRTATARGWRASASCRSLQESLGPRLNPSPSPPAASLCPACRPSRRTARGLQGTGQHAAGASRIPGADGQQQARRWQQLRASWQPPTPGRPHAPACPP